MFYGNGKFGFKSIGIEVSEVGENAHNFNSVSFLFNFFKHYQLFFSDEISTFLTMVSKLGYDEKPNYTKYKEVFKGGLKKLGVKDEWKLSLPISGPANKVILPASLYLLFNKLICKLHFVTKCRLRKNFYFDYLVRISLKRYKTWLTLVLLICN